MDETAGQKGTEVFGEILEDKITARISGTMRSVAVADTELLSRNHVA
jgi:hypothetical protein